MRGGSDSLAHGPVVHSQSRHSPLSCKVPHPEPNGNWSSSGALLAAGPGYFTGRYPAHRQRRRLQKGSSLGCTVAVTQHRIRNNTKHAQRAKWGGMGNSSTTPRTVCEHTPARARHKGAEVGATHLTNPPELTPKLCTLKADGTPALQKRSTTAHHNSIRSCGRKTQSHKATTSPSKRRDSGCNDPNLGSSPRPANFWPQSSVKGHLERNESPGGTRFTGYDQFFPSGCLP